MKLRVIDLDRDRGQACDFAILTFSLRFDLIAAYSAGRDLQEELDDLIIRYY